ncbi:hypothetical protein [Serratia marcescens]|nr:hypothetical protein [Serratia marcescens]
MRRRGGCHALKRRLYLTLQRFAWLSMIAVSLTIWGLLLGIILLWGW